MIVNLGMQSNKAYKTKIKKSYKKIDIHAFQSWSCRKTLAKGGASLLTIILYNNPIGNMHVPSSYMNQTWYWQIQSSSNSKVTEFINIHNLNNTIPSWCDWGPSNWVPRQQMAKLKINYKYKLTWNKLISYSVVFKPMP